MTLALAVLAALLGLLIGSFLNVVIYRLPRGESLSRPGSHCPDCGHSIRYRHNIPVVGWLVLRGRCADCGTRISPRYPLVEAAAAILFVAVVVRLSALDLRSAIPAYLYFVAIGLALAMIDLDVRRLPNAIVLPAYGVIAVLLAASAAWHDDWWALARGGIGAVVLFGFFAALAFAYPGGMGWGDVKLAGVLGLVLGYLSWGVLVVGAFLGFLLGAVIGVAIIASGRGSRKTAVPFGPFMIAGALIAFLIGAPIAHVL